MYKKLNYIRRYFSTIGTEQSSRKSNLQILYNASKKTKTPFFTIQSHLVQIIDDPLQFYLCLHKQSKKAINRIGLSSLYLGTGSLERHLFNQIIKRSKNVPTLNVAMVFDYNRSLRSEKGESPVEMMNYYIKGQLKDRISIAFHRQSNSRHKVLGQISGVHHQKIAIFDDTIIIGGANLSHNYFVNRRDRYMKFNDSSQMADYFYDYLKVLCENGHQLAEKPTLPSNPNLSNHYKLWKFSNSPNQCKQTLFQHQEQIQKIRKQKLFQQQIISKDQTKKPIPKNKNVILSQMLGSDIKPYQEIQQKERLAKRQEVRQRLFNIQDENDVGNQLIEIQKHKDGQNISEVGEKVYIFPFIQFPLLGQNWQPSILQQILDNSVKSNIPIKISSGYLNFTKDIISTLGHAKIPTEILCSSPQANSFYRGGMLKKYIPYFYRNFEGMILQKWPGKFIIKQYFDGKWSFHAKGLWIKQNQNNYLTVVGSSNYNKRSKERDTELQLYLYSTCPRFNYRLDQQWKHIQKDCKDMTLQKIRQDKQIKYNFIFNFLSKLFSRFL